MQVFIKLKDGQPRTMSISKLSENNDEYEIKNEITELIGDESFDLLTENQYRDEVKKFNDKIEKETKAQVERSIKADDKRREERISRLVKMLDSDEHDKFVRSLLARN